MSKIESTAFKNGSGQWIGQPHPNKAISLKIKIF